MTRIVLLAPYNTLSLPWHSGLKADAAPMTPGKAEELVFDLLPTSIIFQPGAACG